MHGIIDPLDVVGTYHIPPETNPVPPATERIPPETQQTPSALVTSGPLPLALDTAKKTDQPPSDSGPTLPSDERTDWNPAEPTVTASSQVNPHGGNDVSVEHSVAVQVLCSLRDQSELQLPAFLANTLSKALATNTLAVSLPASHPCFQKAWDFSQASLSACHSLIGRWKMAHQESRSTAASTTKTKPLVPSLSFDDDFALMDESGELAL